MAKTTGTATDYHDLLDDLRTWLTVTVGWTQLRWTAPGGLTDTAELWVRGPGAGPDRQVFIGFQSSNNVANGWYGWAIRGAINFDGTLPFNQQPGSSPAVFFNTWQNSLPYWFYANDRRVVAVAKAASTYHSLYAGFMLPFALPSEWPFPLYVGSSFYTLEAYDVANSGNRFIADPGQNAAYYRRRATADWLAVANHQNNAEQDEGAFGSAAVGKIWPHSCTRASTSSTTADWSQAGLANLRPNANGESPVWQCHIIDPATGLMAGALDGVFVTPGFNRASEQIINADSRTFRAFQNVFRSAGQNFMAIEEL